VKNRSLLAVDFKRGQLPRGARGAVGPAGSQGPPGDPANFDSSQYFNKTEADARFLGKTAKAADADELDGIDSAALGVVAYARVAGDGTLSSVRKNVASSRRESTGRYEVRLPARPAPASVPLVTLTGGVSPLAMVAASAPTLDGTFLTVNVQKRDGTAVDRPFQILVVC
jgi:hypothetical protein